MSETLHRLTFDSDEPMRLDKYLASAMPDLTRSYLQTMITAGNVTINGMRPKKSGVLLAAGDLIEVILTATDADVPQPEAIPLQILFEDDYVLVVDKPAGMVVHPAAGHTSGTLVNAVMAHVPAISIHGESRPGIVHRLDKNTSGVILVAKDERTLHALQTQFKSRLVRKKYLALVDGHPPTPTGRIEAAIGRDASNRQKMAVDPRGISRDAVSEYREVQRYSAHSLLEVFPHTGRTHQIRVHLAFLGCPVAGDRTYGYRRSSIALDRHFLHAEELKLTLPHEAVERTFSAPLPVALKSVLDTLK